MDRFLAVVWKLPDPGYHWLPLVYLGICRSTSSKLGACRDFGHSYWNPYRRECANMSLGLQENLQKLRELSGQLIDPDIAITIFELLPDAIVVVDRAASIQLVNRQTEFLFGYHRSELFDQPVEILIPESVRELHKEHVQGFMADPRTRPMALGIPLKGRRKDRSEFLAQINLSPVVTRHGLLVMSVIRPRRD
jgi:PAS domain S-box-containing protein